MAMLRGAAIACLPISMRCWTLSAELRPDRLRKGPRWADSDALTWPSIGVPLVLWLRQCLYQRRYIDSAFNIPQTIAQILGSGPAQHRLRHFQKLVPELLIAKGKLSSPKRLDGFTHERSLIGLHGYSCGPQFRIQSIQIRSDADTH